MPLRIPGTDPPVLVLAEQLEHWYNALLTEPFPEEEPCLEAPPQAPQDVFHVETLDVVTSIGGAVILRIYPKGGRPRDIVFHRDHLRFALAASLHSGTPT